MREIWRALVLRVQVQARSSRKTRLNVTLGWIGLKLLRNRSHLQQIQKIKTPWLSLWIHWNIDLLFKHASENVARAFRRGKYRSRDAREHRRQRDSFQRDDDNFVQCGCQQWAMLASRCSTGAANFVTAIVAVRLLVTNPSDRDAKILTGALKLLGIA